MPNHTLSFIILTRWLGHWDYSNYNALITSLGVDLHRAVVASENFPVLSLLVSFMLQHIHWCSNASVDWCLPTKLTLYSLFLKTWLIIAVFIFDLNTALCDWRPSFPGSRSKNMEQPAVGMTSSRTFLAFKSNPKTHLFNRTFSISQ